MNYGSVLEYPIGWPDYDIADDYNPVIPKTVTRNLDNDLHMWEPDKEIDHIVNFAVRGDGIRMYKVETFETTLINQENITLFDPKTPDNSTWRIYDSDPAGATIQLSDNGAVLSGDGIKNGFVLENKEGEDWNLKEYNFVKFEGFFPESDAIIYLTVDSRTTPPKYLAFVTNKAMADYGNYGNVLVTYLPKAKDGKVSVIIDIQKILQTNNIIWSGPEELELDPYIVDVAVRGSGTVTSVIAYDAYEDFK
jgi:hypothetical protein